VSRNCQFELCEIAALGDHLMALLRGEQRDEP
jgi:hypothetical protein